jgi:hypothetical protein
MSARKTWCGRGNWRAGFGKIRTGGRSVFRPFDFWSFGFGVWLCGGHQRLPVVTRHWSFRVFVGSVEPPQGSKFFALARFFIRKVRHTFRQALCQHRSNNEQGDGGEGGKRQEEQAGQYGGHGTYP